MTSYVVVGAGLAGSATAWHLARRGHDVTVLERTTPANEHGSSHGSARIFRHTYPEAFFARLVARSRAEWAELESLAGTTLIRPVGTLDFGTERDPGRLAAVLAEVGVAHEVVPRDDALARWPGIAFDTDVLHHADAGVLDAQTTVESMLRLAGADGARVEHDWPVAEVVRHGTGYQVVGEDGRTVDAERVVVAAGGWLPDLLGSLGLPEGFVEAFPALTVMQENAFHFPYRDDVAPADSWPTFIHKAADINVYSLPGGRDAVRPDGGGGQKLAEFLGGTRISSAAAQTGVVDPVNRERVVEYVRRHLPGLVPEPYAEATCLFTSTPTEDFVLDGVDGVTVLSPCSGHGAKFAPLLGRLAADVATGVARPPAPFRVVR